MFKCWVFTSSSCGGFGQNEKRWCGDSPKNKTKHLNAVVYYKIQHQYSTVWFWWQNLMAGEWFKQTFIVIVCACFVKLPSHLSPFQRSFCETTSSSKEDTMRSPFAGTYYHRAWSIQTKLQRPHPQWKFRLEKTIPNDFHSPFFSENNGAFTLPENETETDTQTY